MRSTAAFDAIQKALATNQIGTAVSVRVVALLADEAILHLDAPVRHLHGRAGDVEARHEHDLIPSIDTITSTLTAIANY